jgi:hypothetical protein
MVVCFFNAQYDAMTRPPPALLPPAAGAILNSGTPSPPHVLPFLCDDLKRRQKIAKLQVFQRFNTTNRC